MIRKLNGSRFSSSLLLVCIVISLSSLLVNASSVASSSFRKSNNNVQNILKATEENNELRNQNENVENDSNKNCVEISRACSLSLDDCCPGLECKMSQGTYAQPMCFRAPGKLFSTTPLTDLYAEK